MSAVAPGSRPDAAPVLPVTFTAFHSAAPLSKAFRCLPDGVIAKGAAADMTAGTAHRVTCDFREFGGRLLDADEHTAFGYGQYSPEYGDVARVVTVRDPKAGKEIQGTGQWFIARSREFFAFGGPGIAMFDHDPHRDGPRLDSPEDLLRALAAVCPALEDCAAWWRGSISARVVHQGETPGPGKGCRLYVPVTDTADLPRFAEALFKRLWLAGRGFIALSAAGSFLARSLIDASVYQPERLDFVGRPVLNGEGLQYVPETPGFRDGGYLDTRLLPDLSADEDAEYRRRVEAAKQATATLAGIVRTQWETRQAARMVARGATPEQARRDIERIATGGCSDLYGSFVLDFDRLGTVTVAEVLADPATYDGATLADPVDGVEYGRGKAMFYANGQNGTPFVNSFAHGGARYFLHPHDAEADFSGLLAGAQRPAHETSAMEPERDAGTMAFDLAAMIDGEPPATRERARLILSALDTISTEAALGGDEKRRPMPAGTVIGRALCTEFQQSALGRALCVHWDSRTGGTSVAAFDKADPNYSKGAPLTADSVFRLAREAGWSGAPGTEADAESYDPPPLSGITPEELAAARPHPPCIVENYLFADLALVAAAGGTGKTTTAIFEAVHIALGRPLWGLRVWNPGATLFITAEDSRELFAARLREILDAMDLPPFDRRKAMSRINVWDVSGDLARLAELDQGGNIRLTGLADAIVEAYRDNPPVMIVFDPCVSFGPGERLVNDSEQAIVTACRRIIRGLGCCVRIVAHTGKANARAGAVDQYASRGGTALPDGCRMVAVLSSVNDGEQGGPPEGFELGPGESGFVLVRAKLSYAPPQPKLWVRRRGYTFEHFTETRRGTERNMEADAETLYEFLRGELAEGRKYTARAT